MYIVKEQLPESCFKCPYNTKCDVWQVIMSDWFEPRFMDYPTPKPLQFKCCKLKSVPNIINFIYYKWLRGSCRHICLSCKHRSICDIYNLYGKGGKVK